MNGCPLSGMNEISNASIETEGSGGYVGIGYHAAD